MLIRPLAIVDLPAAVAIEQAVQVSPWTQVMFSESLNHHDMGWVLIEKKNSLSSSRGLSTGPIVSVDPADKPPDDGICGYILVKPNQLEADILTIAVAKNQQRKGYGQALIAFVLTQFDCLYLEVRVSNQPAIRLYKKMGFEIVGKRPKYYQGEDAWVMKVLVA